METINQQTHDTQNTTLIDFVYRLVEIAVAFFSSYI